MIEVYQFIMKNDVWDIVLRFKGKSVVIFKWIFIRLSMQPMEVSRSIKRDLWLEDFFKWRE